MSWPIVTRKIRSEPSGSPPSLSALVVESQSRSPFSAVTSFGYAR